MSSACCVGLDARAAAIVMRSVKNVSRNGRTVMVTIHQPSIEIFEGFDALFLLQRGGRVSYFQPWNIISPVVTLIKRCVLLLHVCAGVKNTDAARLPCISWEFIFLF